ncbi:hypothetical protein WR25_13559 [Diploscapter pachys]|uniref:Amino acid transporter n=1 Tax=Diploscapter pachys TaxID=2018661 RepID=A0A2A2JCW3_9BILA|nr:hypothetical protein WR25_13559 [Diploscapter pachys]
MNLKLKTKANSNPVARWLKKNLLLFLTVIGVIVGIVGGTLLRFAEPSRTVIKLISFPGELFMNMLKCMILPLIASSLVSGLCQLDAKSSGRLGSRAMLYYCLTTTHAVILGIIIVTIIHPGDPAIKANAPHESLAHANISALDKFMDLLRNMFTDNIVHSMFAQKQTIYNYDDNGTIIGQGLTTEDGMNVLGLITFCIVMGLVLSKIGQVGKPLADLFHAIDAVITKMVMIIMWFGVVGIPSLIAGKMLEVTNLWLTAKTLGMFIVTVITGLAIQCFITLPLILFIGSRQNPYRFLKGLSQAILTALATSSSAATLPITFRCLNNLKIDRRVTKFVLPVGAMVNMDGTALYEATASIFIAQMNGMSLSFGQVLTVSITATLASIGAAAIPSAGLVTMIIVLSALGLPATDISLIFTVDWFLDRLRTATNVVGDAFGCGFVYYLCKDHLNEIDENAPKLDIHGMDIDTLEKQADQITPEGTEISLEKAEKGENIQISSIRVD